MGTPFISLLEPSKLDDYDRTKPHDQQPCPVPKVFRDAMSVREAVFVDEQRMPLEFEYDNDDPRSCHWVVYASVSKVVELEQVDPDSGLILRPRRSETHTLPIGTMRIVPFPHPPHPQPDGWYEDYKLDRATTFHDGQEPYVKVGRLAVLPAYRGRHMAGQLWVAARRWLETHPRYFDPSVTEKGMDALNAEQASEIPHWGGLVCAHAQEAVIKTYERWGFKVDEGMGRWYEEGVPHVGMFLRLNTKDVPVQV
ncbi:acyl-CoA N-acyltransferase [Apiospora hydei]|uniref:Acyl-CoA N-acyltransferase n=1 Tax=Apiospora hydei TaxID=1337664 RepID=A0ABR1XAS5_9PEZI